MEHCVLFNLIPIGLGSLFHFVGAIFIINLVLYIVRQVLLLHIVVGVGVGVLITEAPAQLFCSAVMGILQMLRYIPTLPLS